MRAPAARQIVPGREQSMGEGTELDNDFSRISLNSIGGNGRKKAECLETFRFSQKKSCQGLTTVVPRCSILGFRSLWRLILNGQEKPLS